jgi:uncharacterized protein DUF1801
MCRVGFSPRAREVVLYIMSGFPRHEELLRRLGKHKTGKGCLYIKRLADVDEAVLASLVAESLAHALSVTRSHRSSRAGRPDARAA